MCSSQLCSSAGTYESSDSILPHRVGHRDPTHPGDYISKGIVSCPVLKSSAWVVRFIHNCKPFGRSGAYHLVLASPKSNFWQSWAFSGKNFNECVWYKSGVIPGTGLRLLEAKLESGLLVQAFAWVVRCWQWCSSHQFWGPRFTSNIKHTGWELDGRVL